MGNDSSGQRRRISCRLAPPRSAEVAGVRLEGGEDGGHTAVCSDERANVLVIAEFPQYFAG